jgi:hypothetical protein
MALQMSLHLARLAAKEKALLAANDPPKRANLIDFYVRIAPQLLDAERCMVFIHDPKNERAWLRKGTGEEGCGMASATKDSVVGKVMASGNPVRSDCDVLCVPVVNKKRHEVIGAIEVLNKTRAGGFSRQDESLLTEMAEHLQPAVDKVFLEQEVFGATEKVVALTIWTTLAVVLAVAATAAYGLLPILFS